MFIYRPTDVRWTKKFFFPIKKKLGPFVDSNHDLISSGNIQLSYEELLQKLLDDIAESLRSTRIQVLIQPSLNDVTQDPIYPVHPIGVSTQFIKQNNVNEHFILLIWCKLNIYRINNFQNKNSSFTLLTSLAQSR